MLDVLSITAFAGALSAPAESFATLEGFRVEKTADGSPVWGRTSLFAEAVIVKHGKRSLLCAPLRAESIDTARRALQVLRNAGSARIPEHRLLAGELLFSDEWSRRRKCDLLLCELPDGEPLNAAVTHCATDLLLAALERLGNEFAAKGLLHRNLKPSNLIFGSDGELHPVRCHYMTTGACAEDIAREFARVEEFIRSCPRIDSSSEAKYCGESLPEGDYDCVYPPADMMCRVRRGDRYGFVDIEGREVVAPMYVYAENFFENRAVVKSAEGFMGVIDRRGRYVVEPIYDSAGWSDDNTCFIVRKGRLRGKLNYAGEETEPLH